MNKKKLKSRSMPQFWGRPRPVITICGVSIPLAAELSPASAAAVSARLSDALNNFVRSKATETAVQAGPSEEWLKAVAKIASSAWRAERRVIDPETQEPKEDSRLLYRDIEAVRKALEVLGIETVDETGKAYDSGMALKVVTFESTVGLEREQIIETIKPTVRWQGRLIQIGEVIVGTPEKPIQA